MTTYEYKGMLIRVPKVAKYIGIGPDGMLRCYENKPELSADGMVTGATTTPPVILNWDKTLIETNLLKEFAPLVLNEIAKPGTKPYVVGDKYTIQSSVEEEACLSSEVHIVVSCYTPGSMPWAQVLHVRVNGLSIENKLLASVVEVLHELKTS